jgi:AmmeMemoRadiSam system protein A
MAELTVQEKKLLLKLARKVLLKSFDLIDDPGIGYEVKKLSEKRGVFVTLHKNDNLRGCIGTILPEKELYSAVAENVMNSAFRDPRFSPLSEDELDDLEIEISALTVPVEVEYNNSEDLRDKITPFEDGVILDFGLRQSTFLPQVWEDLPDFDLFMSQLSMKAGMNPDAWKTANPSVKIYKADHFKESELL